MDGNTSAASPPDSDNPLQEIEADLRALMRQCGAVQHELNESRRTWEGETKTFLNDLLTVVDGFENVLHNIGAKVEEADQQTKIWVGNFRTVYKLLLRVLKNAEVIPVEVQIGEKINPAWHNIVDVVQQPDRENETIVEEIKKGYLWKGTLLRTADLTVVKNS